MGSSKQRRAGSIHLLLGSLPIAAVTAAVAIGGIGPAAASAYSSSHGHAMLGRAPATVARAQVRARRHVTLTLRLQRQVQIANQTAYRMVGTVRPRRDGAKVRIQRRTATGWRTVATVRLRRRTARQSQFSLTLRRTGVYRAQLMRTRSYQAANSTLVPLGVSEAVVAPSLSAAVAEEHVAAATYANVIARLGKITPFTNVLTSEQQHITTLQKLASIYAVSLPQGPFAGDPSPATRTDACRLGVTVEQSMIALYDQLLPAVSAYPDISRAFQNLRAGELNSHLPAFQHCS